MDIICKLDALIDKKGISQTKLAEETGIARSSINRMCTNTATRFDKKTLTTLGEYFNLASLSDLLEYSKD